MYSRQQIGFWAFFVIAALAAGSLLPACNRPVPDEEKAGREEAQDRAGVAESAAVSATAGAAAVPATAPSPTAVAEAGAAPATTPGACKLAGSWEERWAGIAAADGKDLAGTARLSITMQEGKLAVRGKDQGNPDDTWAGTAERLEQALTVVFSADDGTYNGRYACQLPGDGGCDRLECTVTALNKDGSPNMTGRATWSRVNP